MNSKNKLNILLFSPTPPPIGGISTWTINYISKQSSLNNVDLIDISKRTRIRIKHISQFIRTVRILIDTYKILKKGNYDLVHINSACSKYGMIREIIICSMIKRKKNISIFLHCHCDISKYINNKAKYKIFMKLCEKVDVIMVLNKQSYNFVCKMNITKKVYIVDNFLNDINIKKIRNNSDFKNVLYVGRYTKRKGINELINAAKSHKDINFYLIGNADKDFNKKVLENVTNIFDLGQMETNEVYKYMSKFDALVLPSYEEGFPMTILEAMFIGLPIITTNVGSIYDMLGKNGAVYINVGDLNSLNQALEVIKSKKLRDDISLRNIKYANANYSSEIVIKKINEIYLKEVNGK